MLHIFHYAKMFFGFLVWEEIVEWKRLRFEVIIGYTKNNNNNKK